MSRGIDLDETPRCIEREQRLCRKDKEEIKENCNKLMEDIFKVGGKND
jgi:hypothetical protein